MAGSAMYPRALQQAVLCSHEAVHPYSRDVIRDYDINFVQKKLPLLLKDPSCIEASNEHERHVLTHVAFAIVRPSAPCAEDVARGGKTVATADPSRRLFPHEAIVRKLSYTAAVVCDVEYRVFALTRGADGRVVETLKASPVLYRELPLFDLPCMTRSSLCNLTACDPSLPHLRHEDPQDLGGLFPHNGTLKKVQSVKEKRQNVPMTTSRGGRVRCELRSNRVDEKVRNSSTMYVHLVPAVVPRAAAAAPEASASASASASAYAAGLSPQDRAAQICALVRQSEARREESAALTSEPAFAFADCVDNVAVMLEHAASADGGGGGGGGASAGGGSASAAGGASASAGASSAGATAPQQAPTGGAHAVVVDASSYLDRLPLVAVFRLLGVHTRDGMLDCIFPQRWDPCAPPPHPAALRALDTTFLHPLLTAPMDDVFLAATESNKMFDDKTLRCKEVTMEDRRRHTLQNVNGELAPQVGFASIEGATRFLAEAATAAAADVATSAGTSAGITKTVAGDDKVDDALAAETAHARHIYFKKALVLGWCVRDVLLKHLRLEPLENVDFEGFKYIMGASDVLGRATRQRWKHFCTTLRKRVFAEIKTRRPDDPLPDLSHVYQRTDVLSHSLAKMMSDGHTALQKRNKSTVPAIQAITATNILGLSTELDRVRTPQSAVGRYDSLRLVNDEQTATICMSDTPEGENAGLVQSLALTSRRRLGTDIATITALVLRLGDVVAALRASAERRTDLTPALEALSDDFVRSALFVRALDGPAAFAASPLQHHQPKRGPTELVFVNFDPVAVTNCPEELADAVRAARRCGALPHDTTVVRNSWGVLVCADEGVLVAPFFVLKNLPRLPSAQAACAADPSLQMWTQLVERGVVEHLCAWELRDARGRVAFTPLELDAWLERVAAGTDVLLHGAPETQLTHLMVHPQALTGTCAGMVPSSDGMPATRQAYQAVMGKQAQGALPLHATSAKTQTILSAQKAVCATDVERAKGLDGVPAGQVVIACIRAAPDDCGHTGGNQEDSVVVNLDAVERGLMRARTQRVHTLTAAVKTTDVDVFHNPLYPLADPQTGAELRAEALHSGTSLDSVDLDGLPSKGARLKLGDCVIGRVKITRERAAGEAASGGGAGRVTLRDTSLYLRCPQHEVQTVEDVLVTDDRQGFRIVKVTTSVDHPLRCGDKMACLTPEHDVLTRGRGWVPIAHVTCADEIATLVVTRDGGPPEFTLNKTHRAAAPRIQWARPTAVHAYECADPYVYCVESPDVSLRTTLNHRMWAATRSEDDYDWTPHNFVEARAVLGRVARYQTCVVDEAGGAALRVSSAVVDAQEEWTREALERYEGRVHCVSVPTEVFLVRRGGKMTFTGNSRHGQKFTVGRLTRAVNLPFVAATGMVPDLFLSITCLISRNTAGLLVEGAESLVGATDGVFKDATPFTPRDPRALLEELVARGFASKETIIDGVTGEVCEEPAFLFPVFVQRLTHEAADKLGARSRGARTAQTRQPIEGRANNGGLRAGTMEADANMAAGAALYLHDRTVNCADGTTVLVCAACGQAGAVVHDALADVSAKLRAAAGSSSGGGAGDRGADADVDVDADVDAAAVARCPRCRLCGSTDIVPQASLWCYAGLAVNAMAMLGVGVRHHYDKRPRSALRASDVRERTRPKRLRGTAALADADRADGATNAWTSAPDADASRANNRAPKASTGPSSETAAGTSAGLDTTAVAQPTSESDFVDLHNPLHRLMRMQHL